MRLCPICQFDESLTIDPDYMGYALHECRQCGHRFVDSEVLSQAWLDDYYLNTYKTDDLPYSDARLNSLAEIDSLPPVDIATCGRVQVWLEAVRLLKRERRHGKSRPPPPTNASRPR